jgi:glutamate-1-semialdehyde 2,1-aminomutase
MQSKFITCFERSNQYRGVVHQRIPGGAHTYSKGDDQFPELAPAAISRGKGGRVWDLDGNEYVDCGLGLGAVSLGHAYGPVIDAVSQQLALGASYSRPASIELDFANDFIDAVPGAERVKFARSGSAVTTAAVKLARAYTGRDLVAYPRNQPFFSYDDWFVGLTFCNAGVPEAIQSLSVLYDSTQPESLNDLFDAHPNKIACVITEPQDAVPVDSGAIQEVERIARHHGALFILDEMVTGYRGGMPGLGSSLSLEPDLATWGKSIGNGFSVCALTGRADVMDLGGIVQQHSPRVFLISTTHGGEAHTLAAGRAVLKEYQKHDVIGHQWSVVKAVNDAFVSSVSRHGLESNIEVYSSGWRLICVCKEDGVVSAALRTLLLQEMIGRGVLFAGYFLPCFTHNVQDVKEITQAFDAACEVCAQGIRSGLGTLLIGASTRPVFRRFNGCSGLCPSNPCPNTGTCQAT